MSNYGWRPPEAAPEVVEEKGHTTAIQVEGNTTWYHLNHCTRTTQPRTREETGKDRDADASRPNQPPQEDQTQPSQELQHQSKDAETNEYAPDTLRALADSTGPREESEEGGSTNNTADLE